MNLRKVHAKFATDEECLQYIQQMRWPDGVVRCPVCGNDKVKRSERKSKSKNKRAWFFVCLERTCLQQFSPTSGTIFHDSHLPLIVWFHAITLILNAKKGISAKQLQRDLGIGGYKTAWYLNHRIREVMQDASAPKLGGIVEIDETYIGGRQKGRGVKYGKAQKQTVIGLRQRGGPLRLVHTPDAKVATTKAVITSHVSDDVEFVMTDQSGIYPPALKDSKATHLVVNHIRGEYVRGIAHTNTIENAFSLLKRGIIGNFHKVSIRHLQRYLDEFSYRFNRRAQGADVFIETVRRLCGFKPLPFASLTAEKA
ncbi:MAG TPA: IS1595 family transposase [Candidatus Binatia bacterium]|nr:IS1595 family transposase [Candidatus Binatia bacterium]